MHKHRTNGGRRALPNRQCDNSILPVIHAYRQPQKPIHGSVAPAGRFRAAVDAAYIGSAGDVAHVTPPIIEKYITNLEILGLLRVEFPLPDGRITHALSRLA